MRTLQAYGSIRYPHTTHQHRARIAIYRYTISCMAHVSSKKLRAKTSIKIKRNLVLAVGQDEGRIIECLLTPTETTMLAKRLAMIVLLERGDSAYRIGKLLNVSVSTAERFHKMHGSGVFKPVSRILRKRKRTFLDLLELVLSAGLPAIAGPNHDRRLQRLRRGE